MNKKFLLAVGVLSMLSTSVMANPINITTTVVGGKGVIVTDKIDTSGNKEYKVSVFRELNHLESAFFHADSFNPELGGYNSINGDRISMINSAKTDNTYITPKSISVYTENGIYRSTIMSDSISINDSFKGSLNLSGNGMYSHTSNGKFIGFTTEYIYAGNQKINGVAKGEEDTDAVNVSQLKEVENKINNINSIALNQANHYTDTQVNKGVAKASALAGLKYLDYNPKDKWSFAASVGHYRNANAVAVGAAYQPNKNTMVHGGITVDGKVAYNLGVSVKVGGQKYINKYDLQDQVRQLQSDNAELRQELNELRSLIGK